MRRARAGQEQGRNGVGAEMEQSRSRGRSRSRVGAEQELGRIRTSTKVEVVHIPNFTQIVLRHKS